MRECRARWAAGEAQNVLAAEFGVSKPAMHRVLTGKRWVEFPEERLCEECGKPGIEPSASNTRKLHAACAKARKSIHSHRQDPDGVAQERAQQRAVRATQRAERYETDLAYREYVDVRELHSLRGRPYLEALAWRVIWTRYRLREADFLRLLAWQQELCPCGAPFTGKPSVDHDHSCCPSVTIAKSCGRCVRGLLHQRCNHLLGVIENNPDVIQPQGWATKYLADPPYRQMLRHL